MFAERASRSARNAEHAELIGNAQKANLGLARFTSSAKDRDMLDGNGLRLLSRRKKKPPGEDEKEKLPEVGDLFRTAFTILSICLIVLVAAKIGRGFILQYLEVRYYPKYAMPEEFKLRAGDADLAIILDEDAKSGTACQQIGSGQSSDQSILIPFAAWLDCFPEEEKDHVSDLSRARRLTNELDQSFGEMNEGRKTEAAVLKEPHSSPAVDYSAMSFGRVITNGLCDRLDDGLFLNGFGCWLFLVLITGGLSRANAIEGAEMIGRENLSKGITVGVVLFLVLQLVHIVGDRGPLHGWFATGWFLPLVTFTQWIDGLFSLAICMTAGWLFVSFRPWCELALKRQYPQINSADWRAAADVVSTPIRVVRVLVLLLIWMFAADFFKFVDQHLHVPEAVHTLWVHAAFLYLSLSACLKFLPEDIKWSASSTGIQIGDASASKED